MDLEKLGNRAAAIVIQRATRQYLTRRYLNPFDRAVSLCLHGVYRVLDLDSCFVSSQDLCCVAGYDHDTTCRGLLQVYINLAHSGKISFSLSGKPPALVTRTHTDHE